MCYIMCAVSCVVSTVYLDSLGAECDVPLQGADADLLASLVLESQSPDQDEGKHSEDAHMQEPSGHKHTHTHRKDR